MPINKNEKTKGQILVIALVVTAVLLILAVGLISITSMEYLYSNAAYKKTQAISLAEAGVEKAISELNLNTNYTGTGGTPVALGSGEFEVSVSGTGELRTIEGTGYIPNKASYKQKKIVKVNLMVSSELLSFRYAVQVGIGGADLAANSTINGNVYCNAGITGASKSQITGDAYAVTTISDPPAVGGSRHPGSPALAMPDLNYTFWKDEAAKGDTHEGDYTINSNTDLGPLKINGKLIINTGATVTMQGPIYATGGFEMNSNSNLRIDNSFGSIGTVLITDGRIILASNTTIYTTSASPKGYILLASTSTDDVAITISSNTSNGLFYAIDGGITIKSNAKAVAVVPKKLTLKSNATLDYDIGLADAHFSTGPGAGWTIQRGSWTEH